MKMRSTPMVCMMAVGLWLSLYTGVIGFGVERYQYLQCVESDRTDVEWRLETGGQTRLVYVEKEEKSVTTIDADFATICWETVRPEENTKVRAERKGNVIRLTGTFQGKTVNREFPIDDKPWYQATTLCFRPFVTSGDEKLEFWILRPSTLEPHRLVARKKGVDRWPVLGEPAEVQQVRIGLPGMLAPLWSGDYWFRKTDGVFVKYEGPNGPPGSPTVVVDLVRVL
ncbi:hypothetical protein [Desulfosudis oleivorans]|uniref:DUF3108 domain-containing protein n=1 Tax=Desulfosudis oleivorans (strain DSM 6200 / JCM 39069 / Hxd3) TaxID=96561 RepID=A8ZYE5_DESOH|nr:hypothetical protein [Desulfosudis oleivorans]ABW68670.1 hypothetical protein Dole_2867 [Desulfosudis oleivorans Hxd3]